MVLLSFNNKKWGKSGGGLGGCKTGIMLGGRGGEASRLQEYERKPVQKGDEYWGGGVQMEGE